jgi:hypothetical protein
VNWFWNSLWWLIRQDERYDDRKLIDPTAPRLKPSRADAGQNIRMRHENINWKAMDDD